MNNNRIWSQIISKLFQFSSVLKHPCMSIYIGVGQILPILKKKLLNCSKNIFESSKYLVLSCQPRVTVTSCFVFKVIRDLESIDHHLCINPIHRIGLIHK